jgi:hypothetical protein
MFLGDSNTFGLGTPLESLWTSSVVKHLEKRWGVPVRQFNLAWGGTGSDYTAMIIHQVVEVLKPNAVFVLWSFVGRLTWFADTRCQVHFIPEWIPDSYAKDHSAYLRLATEPHGFFNYVRNFHLVNDRLLRLGIPYYWGHLEQFSVGMLAPYVPLDGFVGRWQIVDFARDARHGGLRSHALFADLVISAIERERVGPNQIREERQALAASVPLALEPVAPVGISRPRRLGTFGLRPIRQLINYVRLARRVRAMKRRDPFIY